MPKVKLKKLVEYDFIYEVILKVRDINYGGHLGNDSLVSLTHEARIDFLNKLGFSELNIGDADIGIIMTDLIVNYIGEAFLHDEIKIYSKIDEISSVGFRVFHDFVKQDKTIALAELGLYAFNYSERQISNIPEIFIKNFEEFKKGLKK